MQDKRDDYEPIIATRRFREPRREEGAPLWQTVLAVVAVFGVVILLAWWWLSRASNEDVAATDAQQASAPAESFPESHVEQEVAPPARDPGAPVDLPQQSAVPVPAPESEIDPSSDAGVEDAPPPETVAESADSDASIGQPEIATEVEPETPAEPAPVAVRFSSPDSQVRIEVRNAPDLPPVLTAKAGETVELPPGKYRVAASGPQLESFEQDVTFDGAALEYAIELCAQRRYDRESLAGQIVEARQCGSAAECETMFAILGEYADELVRQRDFRMEQCAKWRSGATPDGSWTLNIRCDGAMPSTTCRIEIAEGSCNHAQPPRTARGGACPRAVLK
jgi:hypothetical protein